MASETLLPCPFCAATLSPCEDKGVVFWMHPGVITDDDCVLAGRGFYPKELPAWNRRAAVAELVEDMRLIRAMLTPCKGNGALTGDAYKIADVAISRHQAGLGKGDDRG